MVSEIGPLQRETEEVVYTLLLMVDQCKITSLIESISEIIISYYSRIQTLTLNFSNLRFCFPSQSFAQALGHTKVRDLDILARINDLTCLDKVR